MHDIQMLAMISCLLEYQSLPETFTGNVPVSSPDDIKHNEYRDVSNIVHRFTLVIVTIVSESSLMNMFHRLWVVMQHTDFKSIAHRQEWYEQHGKISNCFQF